MLSNSLLTVSEIKNHYHRRGQALQQVTSKAKRKTENPSYYTLVLFSLHHRSLHTDTLHSTFCPSVQRDWLRLQFALTVCTHSHLQSSNTIFKDDANGNLPLMKQGNYYSRNSKMHFKKNKISKLFFFSNRSD